MRGNQNNADLRQAAGVYFWQIADLWGVSEAYMTRLFRHELTESERTRFLQAVDEISKREQVSSHEPRANQEKIHLRPPENRQKGQPYAKRTRTAEQ